MFLLPPAATLAREESYGHSWMRDALKSHLTNDAANQSPHKELKDYLAALLEDVDNPVAWWGVSLAIIYIIMISFNLC
jgi:hypothetical protein